MLNFKRDLLTIRFLENQTLLPMLHRHLMTMGTLVRLMRCLHLRKMYKLVVVMSFVLLAVRGIMADAHNDHNENIAADGLAIMKMIVANISQIASC